MPAIDAPARAGVTLTPLHAGRLVAALMAVALLVPPAAAHGDAAHAKPGNRARMEQTDWGIAATVRPGMRVVTIRMTDDMRFSPDRLTVRLGEALRLRVRNSGAVMHEFVLGTKSELEAHAALMVKFPTMEHDAPYMAHVAPGKTGEIVWTFNRAGSFDFACLIAGHYQAGMVGKVTVLPAAARATGLTPAPTAIHQGRTP